MHFLVLNLEDIAVLSDDSILQSRGRKMAAMLTLFAPTSFQVHSKSANEESHVFLYIENLHTQKNGWGEVDVYSYRHFEWKHMVG